MAGNNGYFDSTGRNAHFNSLHGIVAKDTLLFVADEQNRAIRQVTQNAGITTTLLRNIGLVRALCLTPSGDTLFFAENRPTNARLMRYVFRSQLLEEVVVLPDPGISSMVIDRQRNLYAASSNTHRIIKIDRGFQITPFAGRRNTPGNVLDSDTNARFRGLRGLAFSRNTDTLFVADTDNNQVKRIVMSTKAVTTLVPNIFSSPRGIFTSRNFDTLFVAGYGSQVIDWIRVKGAVIAGAYIGRLNTPGATNSPSSVQFNGPNYIVVTQQGFMFVTDFGNNMVRRLNRRGFTTTLAGGSLLSDGVGLNSRMNFPSEIVKHPRRDTLFFTDVNNHCIRQINLRTRMVSTITGNGTFGFADGSANVTRFHAPIGLAISKTGDSLFVSEQFNHRIRMVLTRTRITRTIAGRSPAFRDGRDTASRFNRPGSMVILNKGLYIADANNHRIRRISLDSFIVSTIAGSTQGFKDTTSLIHARFNSPSGLATDGKYLYVGDANNQRIRKIDLDSGKVSTLAGSGLFGFVDGAPNVARFRNPQKLSYDGRQYLWVGGFANDAPLRRVDVRTGFTTTISNNAGFIDGSIQTAAFLGPQGALFDTLNNLVYLAEAGNNCIRRIEIFVNQAPSFELAQDTVTLFEDTSEVSIDSFAVNISSGISPVEQGQSVDFEVYPENPGWFSVAPSIDSLGVLRFTPAPDSSGITRVKVILRDNGGTSDNGVDTLVRYFTIQILPVNDPPSLQFTSDRIQLLPETQPVALAWANNIVAGPSNEREQTISFVLTPSNPGMFSAPPRLDVGGTLRFTLESTAIDSSEVKLCLRDNGGTENGGIDSACYQFKIVASTAISINPNLIVYSYLVVFPNPVIDQLEVKGLKRPANFRLVHSTGKVISKGDMIPGKALDFGFLKQGLYALLIQEEGKPLQRISFQKL